MSEQNNVAVSPILEGAERLLIALGYKLQTGDDWLLAFCEQKVTVEIKNACNVSAIPKGLTEIAIQAVAGEFLFAVKNAGRLTGFNLNLDFALKTLQEGDTTTTFAVERSLTPEQRLDALINGLLMGRKQYVSYRCLKW
ncbi:MAG: hypothetical protein RR268_06915 [Kiritimatiellia bacterium]